MLNNRYLFASQFLDYLKKQKISDEERFEGFRKTIKSFLIAAIPADIQQLETSFITGLIAQLQFAAEQFQFFGQSKLAKYAYLYDAFPLQHKISCVYLVSPQEDLNAHSNGKFPAFDLIHLLKKEKLEWGILTNGKAWRLYSTLTPLPYEYYLEVDFTNAQKEDYRVFWQLFTLNLFIPDEYDVTPLEKYIEESEKEAEQIEKHIKNSIDEILENISFGFLTYAGKDKQPLSEEEKKVYFENSVYLLFRLLFMFYAESRLLLPMNNPKYRQNSLEALLAKAKDWLKNGFPDPRGTDLWIALRDLCIAIDQGDSELGIPEYDGGLFDPSEHAFLSDAANQLTNRYFAKVLYRLGYFQRRKNQEVKIEYSDLSVRSLGSLYEGILEYKLFIAAEDMVIRKSDKKVKIVPESQAGTIKKSDRVVQKGYVYFSQDARERHDTGSYYTPEDVVNYMVQNSVRLGLEERWMDFLPQVQRYERELKQAVNEDTRLGILKKFDRELLQFVEEQILTFKVMDPAMGSGHFLVNSLNTITHFILEVLQCKVSISDGPIKHDKTPLPINWKLFEHTNSEVDVAPVTWRRRVVERCIFGIDINPLATELAKLSLWIASAAEGKPLTFLNHHLKSGDSVMGLRLKDLLTYPSKEENGNEMDLFERIHGADIARIKAQFEQLLAAGSDDLEKVFSKKESYEEIEKDPFLNHLKDMATLWLMLSFNCHNKWMEESGLPMSDEKTYFDLLEAAQLDEDEEHWRQRLGDNLYEAIHIFEQEKSVFHWELEFPEIINSGFDVILGNPPFVDISLDNYIGLKLSSLPSRNLYAFILESALKRIISNGATGLLLPISIISATRMEKLRKTILTRKGRVFFINVDSSAHPGTFFRGLNVRLSITFVLLNPNYSEMEVYSSDFTKFYSYERRRILNRIAASYVSKDLIIDGYIPKIGSYIEVNILKKMLCVKSRINQYRGSASEGNIFYYKAGGYNYMLAFDEYPFFEVNGRKQNNSMTVSFPVRRDLSKYPGVCIFFSSLFYWFWTVYSDCFHFSKSDLNRFPINLIELDQYRKEFEKLYDDIKKDLGENAKLVTYNKASGITRYYEYKARYSKHLFDKVDKILAKYYGFTAEELNYVIDYDIKYRTDDETS